MVFAPENFSQRPPLLRLPQDSRCINRVTMADDQVITMVQSSNLCRWDRLIVKSQSLVQLNPLLFARKLPQGGPNCCDSLKSHFFSTKSKPRGFLLILHFGLLKHGPSVQAFRLMSLDQCTNTPFLLITKKNPPRFAQNSISVGSISSFPFSVCRKSMKIPV